MEEFSWEMLKAALDRNEMQYQVGDVVISELRNGNPQEWVITDFQVKAIRLISNSPPKEIMERNFPAWVNSLNLK